MKDTIQSDAALFEEEQRFRQGWLWALVLALAATPLLVLLPLVSGLPARGSPAVGVLIPTAVAALAAGTLWWACLRVRVSPGELWVRFAPFFVDRHIAIPEIAGFTRLRYNPLLAGYGIHFSPYGLVYNVSGREGVQLQLHNGKRVLIGTQRPQELCAALAQAGARSR